MPLVDQVLLLYGCSVTFSFLWHLDRGNLDLNHSPLWYAGHYNVGKLSFLWMLLITKGSFFQRDHLAYQNLGIEALVHNMFYCKIIDLDYNHLLTESSSSLSSSFSVLGLIWSAYATVPFTLLIIITMLWPFCIIN